jgi:predicted Zn-dependent protease
MKVGDALATAIDAGAGIAIERHTCEVNARAANNHPTTSGHAEANSLGAICTADDRFTIQRTDLMPSTDVPGMIQAGVAAARQLGPAPDASPLAGPHEAGGAHSRLDGEELPCGGPDLDSMAGALQRVLSESREHGLVCAGYAFQRSEREILALSTGVRRESDLGFASLGFTVRTADSSRSSFLGRSARRLSQIDAGALFAEARRRLEWTDRTVSLPPGDYEVILDSSAAADLLNRLFWEMHAQAADEGRTLFSSLPGKGVGEQLYSPLVTVESDPDDPEMPVADYVRTLGDGRSHHDEQGGVGLLGYLSVFDSGFPIPPATWIDKGVQGPLVCNRSWARDHDHEFRPRADNLRMRGTSTTLDEMIASTKRGLLINSFWYVRAADPSALLLTGSTRDGVYLIENGEVTAHVNNFRFTNSAVEVFKRTVEVGEAHTTLTREYAMNFASTPPIRVETFHLSSVSEAV